MSGDKMRDAAQEKVITPVMDLICYVCGSKNLSTEKCKVWCKDCHALIENCSGD